jgi:hypothetical protein
LLKFAACSNDVFGSWLAEQAEYRLSVGNFSERDHLVASSTVDTVGVQGAASYGGGCTRALKTAGFAVVDVEGPASFDRRRSGKSDRVDA